MDINDLHYDVKFKLNKVDSSQYRNLRIPEIDWALNAAQELIVKIVAEPRLRNGLGFETSQRTIDDIRTLVVEGKELDFNNDLAILPEDYWHFVRGFVKTDKKPCGERLCRLYPRRHGEDFEDNPHYKSSYEWGVVNGLFFDDKIRVFTDNTFDNKGVVIDYIKKLPYIHNAEKFVGGKYKLPNGTMLLGKQDCILPEQMHREISDLAVYIIQNGIASNMEGILQKLKINQLI